METALQNPASQTPQPAAPLPIFNCPNCSVWLPSGTMACPECQTIVYSDYLRGIAMTAQAQENSGKWVEARETWRTALPWLPPGTKQHAAVEQRIGLIDNRLRADADNKAKWTKRLGPLAPVVYFLAKFKTLFLLLSKAKFLLSFLVTMWFYAAFYGWPFGIGFTLGILVHEMGHYVAAKRRGLRVDLPIFLPGLGAYVRWYSEGISLEDLSSIALAGPFFGLLAAGICGAISIALGEPATGGLFSTLAHYTALLNLLNLLPIFGLDGAQATFALNRTQRCLVLAASLIFFGLLGVPLGLLYLVIALGMLTRLWDRDLPQRPSTKTLVQFILLLFVLGVEAYVFHGNRRRF